MMGMGIIADHLLRGYMSPEDAAVEGFFGVIMALDVSNIMRLALIGQSDEMVFAALSVAIIGCNFAWGMADGMMNALSGFYSKMLKFNFIQGLRASSTDDEASFKVVQALRGNFSVVELQLLDEKGLDSMGREITRCAKTVDLDRPKVGREEYMKVLITVAMNVLLALPILATYFLLTVYGINIATLVANIVGLGLLFYLGLIIDRKMGKHRFYAGITMAMIGFLVLGIVIAMGG
jgi:hypothetical protein